MVKSNKHIRSTRSVLASCVCELHRPRAQCGFAKSKPQLGICIAMYTFAQFATYAQATRQFSKTNPRRPRCDLEMSQMSHPHHSQAEPRYTQPGLPQPSPQPFQLPRI